MKHLRSIFTPLFLFFMIVCVYLPSFGNQFVWDDEQFIVKNVFTTSWKYLPQIFTTNTIAGAGENSNYYRPLTTLSFLVDRSIWGLNPLGFHLTNTLLHAGAAILLFFVLKKLHIGHVSSWWIALLFGVHPIQTEAVVYMNSRGDSLFTFFLFSALLSFLYLLERKTQALRFQGYAWKITPAFWGVITCLCFALSVLSKEIGVVGVGLLGIVWMFHHVVSQKRQFPLALREQRMSLFVLGICTLFFAVYMTLRLTVLNFANTLNFYGGDTVYTSSLLVRLATFSRIFFHYLFLLIIPYPLHMERTAPIILSLFNPWTIGIGVLMSVIGGIGLFALRRYREMTILLGMAWVACALAPVSGLIPINGLMYEHWLYVPLVGVFLVAFGIGKIGLRWVSWRWKEELILSCLVLLVGVYTLLTVRQNWIWRNPISFYTYTLRYAQSARLHNNLAMSYDDAQLFDRASEEYRKALELSTVYPQIYYNYARTLVNLGKIEEAESQFRKALERDDHFDVARMQLAALFINGQQWQRAKPLTDVLFERYPNQVDVLLMHGAVAIHTQDPTQATIDFQKALILSGSDPTVQQTISRLSQK